MNYQQYINYGHAAAVTAQAHKYPSCPHCKSPYKRIIRLKRSWWRRLLSKKGHYRCLECNTGYWASNKKSK